MRENPGIIINYVEHPQNHSMGDHDGSCRLICAGYQPEHRTASRKAGLGPIPFHTVGGNHV